MLTEYEAKIILNYCNHVAVQKFDAIGKLCYHLSTARCFFDSQTKTIPIKVLSNLRNKPGAKGHAVSSSFGGAVFCLCVSCLR